jgi:hypothetical protein
VLENPRKGVGWLNWPCAGTPAETLKAVDVRRARETMEPRQTEFKGCRASSLEGLGVPHTVTLHRRPDWEPQAELTIVTRTGMITPT